VVPHK